jgi:hypothetical protein
MELDDTRYAILDAAGHLLIEGGPGSGKTTIALLKAARTLETLQLEQRVVFLSFSRAAVRQISDRVAEHLPRVVRDRLEIRTFHAFFMDFVRAHGPLLTGTPAVFLPPDAENTRKADHDGDWDAEARDLARCGTYVFNQLAPVAATLLERSPALRRLYSSRYPLVIVDEFQDTNLDQWRVIQALAEGSTIICLADPDQRIFEDFIPGVDEARLQQAVEVLDPARFDLAGDNHRSAGNGILDYANAVLRNRPAPLPEAVEEVRYRSGTAEQLAHHAIVYLQRHLAEQLGRLPTIAVLAPSSVFAAAISEAISREQRTPTGVVLPPVDHELVWDPGLSAAAGFVVAGILEWPAQPRADAVTAEHRRVLPRQARQQAVRRRPGHDHCHGERDHRVPGRQGRAHEDRQGGHRSLRRRDPADRQAGHRLAACPRPPARHRRAGRGIRQGPAAAPAARHRRPRLGTERHLGRPGRLPWRSRDRGPHPRRRARRRPSGRAPPGHADEHAQVEGQGIRRRRHRRGPAPRPAPRPNMGRQANRPEPAGAPRRDHPRPSRRNLRAPSGRHPPHAPGQDASHQHNGITTASVIREPTALELDRGRTAGIRGVVDS